MNTRSTNVRQIHVNMVANVRITLDHILVYAIAAIQGRHAKAMLMNARQVYAGDMVYVTTQ